MSAIIGYVDKGKVYFATDTQRTADNYRYNTATQTGANVFYMPNGVMCAAVEMQTVKQLIMARPEWFEELDNNPLTKKYIVENIIPKLYDFMESFNVLEKDSVKNGDSCFDGAILLAQGDRLFCIDGDFSVFTIPKFCIIGSAPTYCYPRVALYDGEIPLKQMLYTALTDAKKFCKMVSPPYYLYSSDGEKEELSGGNSQC